MPEVGAVQKAPPQEDQEDHREEASADTEEAEPEGQEQPDDAEPETLMTYSAVEVLRAKDFAKLSEDELHSVTALIHSIDWRPDLRRTRRKRRAAHGAHLDLRRVLRYGLRYGGETIELAWQRPKLKRRPLVVLCDVSGSMDALLAHLAAVPVRTHQRPRSRGSLCLRHAPDPPHAPVAPGRYRCGAAPGRRHGE